MRVFPAMVLLPGGRPVLLVPAAQLANDRQLGDGNASPAVEQDCHGISECVLSGLVHLNVLVDRSRRGTCSGFVARCQGTADQIP